MTSIRRATPQDADALARNVIEGVADYESFAPDWKPPAYAEERAHYAEVLADAHTITLVAAVEERIAGQITVLPATRARRPVDDPALGHVSNLIVRREHWGSGLAGSLHAAAVDAAREQGITRLRLFVAAGQARARRFYEREGWTQAGEPFAHDRLGLSMVEYRLELGDA